MKTSLSVEKAKLDPFFGAVLRHYGEDHLESAGFFDDGADLGVDMSKAVDNKFLVTPLSKIINQLNRYYASDCKQAKELVVLVSSGGFCPIHNGHLLMMESAKQELESRGCKVVGGFITPDHDRYVKAKCGELAIPAETRVRLAQIATRRSEWLAVDPWASCYLDRAVNYTDIVRRLDSYLKANIPENLKVYFVCGEDNAEFYKTFVESGSIVIVPRANSQKLIKPSGHKAVAGLVANRHEANNISSRNIRSGDLSGLPEDVAAELAREKSSGNLKNVQIFLRDEEGWSVKKWAEKFGEKVYSEQVNFERRLEQLFEEAFWLGMPHAEVSIQRMSLSEQLKNLSKVVSELGLPTISLDACIAGDINIALSRRFELSESIRKEGLFERPGTKELSEQIAAIPAGKYCLIDDDIATGKTIQDFMRRLPNGVKIEKIISVNELTTGASLKTIEVAHDDNISDVGDVRDFLLGSKDGGLVVELPDGEIVRVPYLLPYVQNSSRMSMPSSAERWFSRRVWELNANFFSQIGEDILVSDCSENFQKFAKYLGFNSSTTMLEICRWHLKQLKSAN